MPTGETQRPISKLLIANRGEIAVRVIRTARRMGIATVAVYSDADAGALHTRVADEAVAIGPAPAAESYLCMEAVLAAARATGAEAIHPGFGFLSENAEFAAAVRDAGLVWIGPPPDAIRAMGVKDRAKALMEVAGVPVVPGYHGDAVEDSGLAERAAAIGYPVLVKAVAGGGGKGMKVVESAADLGETLASARREAAAAFGNPAVLIEKYLPKARHIEVQVFADTHGATVHLFERDCSLQRRHQKVVEEAPAPGLDDQTRVAMTAAAVRAAQAVGYTGAGTVEFIVDASQPPRPDGFYFMEMNTRLQVEHPVSEAILGLDLVEWQIRVAAGEPLPLSQSDIESRRTGHAIEARLYAEDAAAGFLPAIGTLRHLRWPEAGVRIDTGVEQGDAITPHYDPMIAKLIVHGTSRGAARAALVAAIRDTEVAGLTTNLAFLAAALEHPAFVAGGADTRLLERDAHTLLAAMRPSDEVEDLCLAAVSATLPDASQPPARDPWAYSDGFRMSAPARTLLVLSGPDGRARPVAVARAGSQTMVHVDGASHGLVGCSRDGQRVCLERDGHRLRATVLHSEDRIEVLRDGRCTIFTLFDPIATAEAGTGGSGDLRAPMPGKITDVRVAAGDAVTAGAPLLVLEAMKMEHVVRAPADGRIESLPVSLGDQVGEGALLVRLAETAAAD